VVNRALAKIEELTLIELVPADAVEMTADDLFDPGPETA
jgi:hypothetical protein